MDKEDDIWRFYEHCNATEQQTYMKTKIIIAEICTAIYVHIRTIVAVIDENPSLILAPVIGTAIGMWITDKLIELTRRVNLGDLVEKAKSVEKKHGMTAVRDVVHNFANVKQLLENAEIDEFYELQASRGFDE